jgi:hypothetical protein
MVFILIINASCIYNWSIQNFKINYNDFIEALWNYRKHLHDWLLFFLKKTVKLKNLKIWEKEDINKKKWIIKKI